VALGRSVLAWLLLEVEIVCVFGDLGGGWVVAVIGHVLCYCDRPHLSICVGEIGWRLRMQEMCELIGGARDWVAGC
jgi:hypothetical protein